MPSQAGAWLGGAEPRSEIVREKGREFQMDQEECRFSVYSAVLRGVEAVPVQVEVSVSRGVPGFSILGMADASVQESRERVKAALRSGGYEVPSARVTVSLAPGDLRKTGRGFDLPIAAAVLAATGQIEAEALDGAIVVGELSTLGEVRPARGMVAFGALARETGLALMCGREDAGLSAVDGLDRRCVGCIADLRRGAFAEPEALPAARGGAALDYADVPGCEQAKRALQVAAAGGHHALILGPPDAPKAALAARLASILPPLTEAEALETAGVHSAAGAETGPILGGARPFRSPDCSVSLAGLLGGGAPLRPGEVSFASNGVLFLDEFSPFVLQGVLQALGSGRVAVTRADGSVDFPARFMLVAAANPCPCGRYGDEREGCTCTTGRFEAYRARLGGPLGGWFAVRAHVGAADALRDAPSASSAKLREGVLRAREFAAWRSGRDEGGLSRRPALGDALRACRLDGEGERLFGALASGRGMDGGGVAATLAVARTVADMEERERVGREDLLEAFSLRG